MDMKTPITIELSSWNQLVRVSMFKDRELSTWQIGSKNHQLRNQDFFTPNIYAPYRSSKEVASFYYSMNHHQANHHLDMSLP